MSVSVSIIIPSLNSPIIDKVVTAVLAQSQSESINEILIIGKDDQGLIPKQDQVRFIDTELPVRASEARNLGIRESTAELLVFLDSDCLPQPEWLMQHINGYEAGHLVVGGGVVPDGKNYWQLVYNLTLFHEYLTISKQDSRNYLPTLNLSIARSVIEQVGMLDESIDRVEDIEWTTRMRRAGFQPYFWPKAAIFHDHNRTEFKNVWQDCAHSGYYMRWLRLQNRDMLESSPLLKYPRLILLLSPFIAGWALLRMIKWQPVLVKRFWQTLLPIYISKIAWCWGASRPEPVR